MDDREILECLRARSDLAMDSLSNRYGTYCRSIAFRILQSDEDVEECLNDVYFKLWSAVASTDIADLKGYIAAVTRNTAVDIYNKREAQQTKEQELAIHEELEECLWVADNAAAVTETLVIKDTLNAFLKTLNTTERWVFMRRYWNMDSIKSIADACGKRETTIRMMLSRTRKKLKIQLEKEGIIV